MEETSKKEQFYEATSLCYFNENNNIWQWTRVADIKDGKLVPFSYDQNQDFYYENRLFLPNYASNTASQNDLAVFSWADKPSNNDDSKAFVQIKHMDSDCFPIQVFTLPVQDIAQAISALQTGISMGDLRHDVMYIFGKRQDNIKGILCTANSMELYNDKYRLKRGIVKVPFYLLSSYDILQIHDPKKPENTPNISCTTFLRNITLETSDRFILTKTVNEAVKEVILKSRVLTWNAFRDFTSNADGSRKYTQKELRLFRDYLAQVNDSSVQKELSEHLDCSISTAENYIENFIENADTYLSGEEVDTQLLSRLVMANDKLREKYTALVEEKWKTDSTAKIDAAEQKIKELDAQCEEKQNTLNALCSDIEKSRTSIQELQNEVAHNTTLAQESYALVQGKIAAAKNDVTHFLADMACYLPSNLSAAERPEIMYGSYVNGAALASDKIEIFDNWESIVGALRDNLRCVGVAQEYENSLAAFLYSAYCTRTPLLLAGYAGEEIGQALSVSVFGKYADLLTCSGDCNLSLIHEAFSGDGILLVRDPFCGNWINALIQEAKASRKQVIFCHPYTEDLAVEPQSLFNYMLPIFTDEISDNAPALEDMIGARLKPGANDFEPIFGKIVSDDIFSELGISKILRNKMQALFASTGLITKTKEDSLIYGCVLTSYAASTEKGNQLCRAIKEHENLTQDIKKSMYRYFNYEEA